MRPGRPGPAAVPLLHRRPRGGGLQWRDLQDPAGERPVVAIHGKGGRTRHVALPLDCARALAQLQPAELEPQGAVFRTRSGRALLPRAAGQIVSAAAVRAGLTDRVSPHWAMPPWPPPPAMCTCSRVKAAATVWPSWARAYNPGVRRAPAGPTHPFSPFPSKPAWAQDSQFLIR